MRAETIRRLLVFGVCCLGLSALYLVPGLNRAPVESALPPPSDQPTRRLSAPDQARPGPSETPRPSRNAAESARGAVDDRRDPAETTAPRTPTADDTHEPLARASERRSPSGTDDQQAPTRVSGVTAADATRDRLEVDWSASSDDVGVASYTVLLNGYAVATTTKTHARLRWFNDDASQHVVQVRAVDAAGNESATSAAIVVDRPSDDPTAPPTPSESPSPELSDSPSPEASVASTPDAPEGDGTPST